jgi:hypothetical protein
MAEQQASISGGDRKSLQIAIGKLLLDESFRTRYGEDAGKALAEANLHLSEVELEVLAEIHQKLKEYADSDELKELKARMGRYRDETYVPI